MHTIKHLSAVLILVLGVSLTAHDALAFVKKKDKSTVFEVPTTGTILDVKYHPEFDEWWVHCREGDNIVVYTYDHRNQSWAKVTFTPKKPEDKAPKMDKPDRTRPTGDAVVAPPKEEPKPEPPKPEPKKEPDKKWWDPLKLLPGADKAKPEGK